MKQPRSFKHLFLRDKIASAQEKLEQDGVQAVLTPSEIHALKQLLRSEITGELNIYPTEATPDAAHSVLSRARHARDSSDYLRLLSSDPSINAIARNATLPALLMNDALSADNDKSRQRRAAIIDALMNLQHRASATAPARSVQELPRHMRTHSGANLIPR